MPYSRHPRTPKRESAVQSVVCRNRKSASYLFFGSKHKIRMAGCGETMSLTDTTEQNHHKRFVLGRGLNIIGTTKTQLIVVEPDDTIDGIIPTRNRTFRPILRRIEAECFRCSVEGADRRINPIAATFRTTSGDGNSSRYSLGSNRARLRLPVSSVVKIRTTSQSPKQMLSIFAPAMFVFG